MKILYTLLILLFSSSIIAQDCCGYEDDEDSDFDVVIATLISNDEYSGIIDRYGNQDLDYSASSLYSIGFAYYMTSDDENCIKYMDLFMAKDSVNPAPYFIKASALNFTDKLEEAIPCFYTAIRLDEDSLKKAESYRGLGYSYYHLQKYDESIDAYEKAIAYAKEIPISYMMIAQIYSDTNREGKALETYYSAKRNIPHIGKEYIDLLFNIGLLEQLKGDIIKAESAFSELISIAPDDFHTHAKLVQVYYHNKAYDKAKPLKEKLYKAYKQGLLNENMDDMFCIDQFKYKDKSIQVFERYQQGDANYIYDKIIFYISNKEGKTEYSIQTEYSPAAVMCGEAKYMLCASKDDTHINYGVGFDDDSSYEDIKNTVIAILKKEK